MAIIYMLTCARTPQHDTDSFGFETPRGRTMPRRQRVVELPTRMKTSTTKGARSFFSRCSLSPSKRRQQQQQTTKRRPAIEPRTQQQLRMQSFDQSTDGRSTRTQRTNRRNRANVCCRRHPSAAASRRRAAAVCRRRIDRLASAWGIALANNREREIRRRACTHFRFGRSVARTIATRGVADVIRCHRYNEINFAPI